MKKILINDKEYKEYEYPKEEEFENDIVKHAKQIFGEKTIYIDVKKLLKDKYNKNNTKPDGYLLDYTIEEHPRLYLVENELKWHSVREHIADQLVKFAFNYKHNLLQIKNIVINYIMDNNIDIDSISKKAGFRNADDMLTAIISKERLGVIIPIDEITDELRELKSMFRFDIELLEFKKYINNNNCIFTYDEFNDDSYVINNKTIIDNIPDTVLVSAEIEGFEKVFLNENCWYEISIGINMLDKLKYIAVYQKNPIKKITYYAEISNIELYNDTGKYIIYFKDKAKKLPIPIPLNPENPNKAPQGRVYTNIDKILNATPKTTLDDIF